MSADRNNPGHRSALVWTRDVGLQPAHSPEPVVWGWGASMGWSGTAGTGDRDHGHSNLPLFAAGLSGFQQASSRRFFHRAQFVTTGNGRTDE